mgnify:FL=1|jgi:predicted nucleotide-binding protein (sugar kinase/HSP70/actin superfamily)|tara:strand:- start:2176 stop:2634 length:459 start_codon:yes stop_codon:yes gene_type:complete
MINWIYENKEFDTIKNDSFGFVYKITHTPSGKVYIGRKNFFTKRNKRLGKKELEIVREERKLKKMRGKTPTKKLIVAESDWKLYWGSNPSLNKFVKEEGKEKFTREILEFAFNKKHLTYLETKYLFKLDVLENPKLYWNDNILAKFFTKDFI